MMKRKKVYKNDARPRINPQAYLSNDGKKKVYKFGTKLSYLSTWSMMKREKGLQNDARPKINPSAYLSCEKKKKKALMVWN